jgi:Arrestin (or S-antigen), N-terminal domain
MALSIILSQDASTVYTPGSVVSGTVKLTAATEQAIESVTIFFTGQCKVLLIHSRGDMAISRTDYRSCGHLFSQHLTLYRGKYTHREGTYMWPFAFRIPTFVHPTSLPGPDGRGNFFECKAPWRGTNHPEPHPLPPTLDYHGAFLCSVEYVLHATLVRPPNSYIFFRNNLDVSKRILVQCARAQRPTGPLYHIRQRTFHIQSFERQTLHQRRILSSLSHAVKRAINSSEIPQLSFTLSIFVPKVLEGKSDKPIPILISATHHRQHQGSQCSPEDVDVALPVIQVKHFALFVIIHTHVRAGCHELSEKKKVSLGTGTCEIPMAKEHPVSGSLDSSNESPLSNGNLVNLGDVANIRVSPVQIIPEFSTCNIFRAYSLELKFHLVCGGKSMKFEFRDITVDVLPDEGTWRVESDADRPMLMEGQVTPDERLCVGSNSDLSNLNDLIGNEMVHEQLPSYEPRRT